jgi:hypothetical protein
MTKKTCSIDGCDHMAQTIGLCQMHYMRLIRHGTTDVQKKRTCSVEGCHKPRAGNGLCAMHYNRMREHGSVESVPVPTREERFFSHVDKNGPGGCWLWIGGVANNGYSKFWDEGHFISGHRFSYEHFKGPIPKGMCIDHLCNIRNCVNPEHMIVATNAENILRSTGPAAKNALKTHCPKGHPYDASNTYAMNDGRGRACRTCLGMKQLDPPLG